MARINFDPYEVLGVAKSADADEIKKAYRKLAMELHPDRNPGNANAEEQFKQVNEAYSILGDAQKRAAYDRGDFDTFGAGGAGGGFDFFDPMSIFESFFGGSFGGSARGAKTYERAGETLKAVVEVSLEDVFAGAERKMKYAHYAACQECGGKGYPSGEKLEVCPECKGRGYVRRVAQTFFGTTAVESECATCNGSGKKPTKVCKKCAGTGRVRVDDEFVVNIPKGIADGHALRYVGKGNAGYGGGVSGDLMVFVRVLPHARFIRRDADIFSTHAVGVALAALGAKTVFENIDGEKIAVELKEGTQFGDKITVRGKGLPSYGGGKRGDLVIQILVIVPEKLSRKERELMEQFAGVEREPKGSIVKEMLKKFGFASD